MFTEKIYIDDPKKIETIDFEEYTYIRYLNKLFVYDLEVKDLRTDTYYLFNNDKIKRKVLLQYRYCYPAKDDDLTTYDPIKGLEPSDRTTYYVFSIVKDYPLDEEITKVNLVLDGFRDVIDDRNYFYSLPLVNEVFHDDNFIISMTNVRVCGSLGSDIDSFNITWEQFYNPCSLHFATSFKDKHHFRK